MIGPSDADLLKMNDRLNNLEFIVILKAGPKKALKEIAGDKGCESASNLISNPALSTAAGVTCMITMGDLDQKQFNNIVGGTSKKVLKNADDILKQQNVQDTLKRIEQGKNKFQGHDGETYLNSNALLPSKPAGYYKEYTVETPGVSGRRGSERLVVGNGGETYYTNTHYGDLPGEPFIQLK